MSRQAGSQRPGGARLGNTGNSSSALISGAKLTRSEKRESRFKLRNKMRGYADRTMVPVEKFDPETGEQLQLMRPREDRFLGCGRRARSEAGTVGVKFDGTTAGFAGLLSCGSAWVCPVCAAKIQQQRAADLGAICGWARREQKTIALVTFTVRHKRTDSLAAVWDAVSAGWAAVTAGSSWVSEKVEKYSERLDKWEAARQLALEGLGRMPRGGRANIPPVRRVGDQERFQLLGWARAAEATHSPMNGWHVHLHVLMVLDGPRDEAALNAERIASRMWDRWEQGIGTVTDAKGHGFTALKNKGGLDVRVSAAAEKRLADYLAKDGFLDSTAAVKASVEKAGRAAAFETVSGGNKKGRRNGRTPFQILDAINPEAPGADLAVWREWVEGSMGRRQLTTSAGLRELAGLAADELTDEEIAEQEDAGETVLLLPRETWEAVRDESFELLTVLELCGVAALRRYLSELTLNSYLPDETTTGGNDR